MNKFKKTGRKALSVFLSATTTLWLIGGVAVMPMAASAAALTQSQVSAIISLLQSFGADSSTIANVQASLTGGTPTGGSSGTATECAFNRSLTLGSTGEDVKCLQKFLNGHGYPVSSTGPGSLGSESTYFGAKTKAAVAAWQLASGITPPAGFFGSISRAAYASTGGTTPPPPPCTGTGCTTPPPPGVGTGLTVSAATQPQAALAPANAARVPFTKFTLTASNDGDVTVNGLTVERTGPSADLAFLGIVLLDEAGNQIGLSKTLNSNHQAVLTEPVVVKAGQSRTLTLAGNMNTAANIGAGNVAFLALNAVNTSATVNGILPIVGSGQTMNQALTIGTLTNITRGPSDPSTTATKEVGTTGYTFSSIQVTAGAAEKVKIHSIRWNQSGSASALNDFANLKTYLDGVAYPAEISSDGKYVSSNFGGKILDKGASAEILIKGDIVGGSGRTIEFDIYRTTDLNVSGETFGYGITPDTSTLNTGFSAGNPWYTASAVTVSAGSLQVAKATAVAAQNIAVNLLNQPLGGFDVTVRGESITVASTVFRISNGSGNVTSVSLVDQTGKVLAGPVDASSHVVTFTDSITYPIGVTTVTLKGKIPTGTATDQAVTASTTPASSTTANSNWSSITGQVTGNSIVVTPAATLTGNTMTVKAGGVALSVSSSPVAQTFVGGGQTTFANYQFDATNSGEDVRFVTLQTALNMHHTTATSTTLTNCQLWDGVNALTTGSNAKNPTAAGSTTAFTFDSPGFTVAKATSKTLALSCNVAGGVTGQIGFGLAAGGGSPATYTASGLTSGSTVTPTVTASAGQKMTLASGGTLTVAEDTAASLSYKLAQGGSSGVTLARLKFHATNEVLNLNQISLQLTNTASSTAADFVGNQVKLYKDDGTTLVGTVTFPGSLTRASSTVSGFSVPANSDAYMIVKADLSPIGTSQAGTQGHLIAVDYDNDSGTGTGNSSTKAIGAQSGSTVYSTSATTGIASVRVFSSVPTVADATTATTAQSGQDLYKFTITAPAAVGSTGSNGVQLAKVSFSYATSSSACTLSWTGVQLFGPNGNVNATAVSPRAAAFNIRFGTTTSSAGAPGDRFIGAGSSKTYALRGTLSSVGTCTAGANNPLTITLIGDTSYPGTGTLFGASATMDGTKGFQDQRAFMSDNDSGTGGYGFVASTTPAAAQRFIWSPQATTTVVAADNDWTNSYGLPIQGSQSTMSTNLTTRTFNFTN
ncbi:MAG: peptidoglycan-binding domain-containing protein [Patescibacteria group bacterium]